MALKINLQQKKTLPSYGLPKSTVSLNIKGCY